MNIPALWRANRKHAKSELDDLGRWLSIVWELLLTIAHHSSLRRAGAYGAPLFFFCPTRKIPAINANCLKRAYGDSGVSSRERPD